MSTAVDDRYEFRCWGDDLSRQAAILTDDWREVGTDRSRATYVLGGAERFAVKLRDGRFEVKEKLRTEGRLELWRPVAGIAFPLSMDELAPWLEQAFGLSGEVTAGEEDLDEAALGALLAEHTGTRLLPVEKDRRRFELAGVLAEHVAVQAAGQRLETVAVEGEEPTTVFTGMRLLRIEEQENLAYPARLIELAKRD